MKRPAPVQAEAAQHQAFVRFREAVLTHDAEVIAESAPQLNPKLDCLRQTIACQAAQAGDVQLATRLADACDDIPGARYWVGRQLVLRDSPAIHGWISQSNLDAASLLGLLEAAVLFGRGDLLASLLAARPLHHDEAKALAQTAAQYPRPAIVSALRAAIQHEAWALQVPESTTRSLQPAALALLDALDGSDAQVLETLQSARPQTLRACLGDLLAHGVALGRGNVLLEAIESGHLSESACRDVLAAGDTTYTLALCAFCSGDASALSMLQRWGAKAALRRAATHSLGPQAKRGALDALVLAPRAGAGHAGMFDQLLEAARQAELEAQPALEGHAEAAEALAPAAAPRSPSAEEPAPAGPSSSPAEEPAPASVISERQVDLDALHRRLDAQDLRVAKVEQENAALRGIIEELRRRLP